MNWVVQISSSESYWKGFEDESHGVLSFLEDFARASDYRSVDSLIREMFLTPKKFVKLKFPKNEARKQRSVWKIVTNLPATFSVLEKKTQLAKATLSKYLRKLESIEVVVREINLYRLREGLARQKNGKTEILWSAILNRWYHLPEYADSQSNVLEEFVRGRKPTKIAKHSEYMEKSQMKNKINKLKGKYLKKKPSG